MPRDRAATPIKMASCCEGENGGRGQLRATLIAGTVTPQQPRPHYAQKENERQSLVRQHGGMCKEKKEVCAKKNSRCPLVSGYQTRRRARLAVSREDVSRNAEYRVPRPVRETAKPTFLCNMRPMGIQASIRTLRRISRFQSSSCTGQPCTVHSSAHTTFGVLFWVTCFQHCSSAGSS